MTMSGKVLSDHKFSSDDVRSVKVTGMDMEVKFVGRFMPVISTLQFSSNLICDRITLLALKVYAFWVEKALQS